MSKAKKIGKISAIIIAVLAVIFIFSSVVITYKDEYKLVRVFGKVDRVITEEGISFKIPFIEEVDTLPKEILLYDLASSDVITKDKKTMVADTYVLWRIEDPLLFAQTLSASVTNAEGRINAAVFNALKEIIGSMTQAEVISARDGLLSESIANKIGNSMSQYGIMLVDVQTKHLDLPSDNKAAVYERMISERNQMAAQYTAEGDSESQIIKNTTDKEVSIMISEAEAKAEQIMAEGEAQYMQILSDAYKDSSKSDFYTFVRSLDAAKASLIGDNKTLILNSDSPIAQIFLGK
ncbi:MAG: protease modulator HflC [Lachnospiraceae bacterium]|nr:protease modulator HflC [Lachnospiraceae bacterium]MDE6698156.1 protease modulator HflC [Lachnospiraceae bacterium]